MIEVITGFFAAKGAILAGAGVIGLVLNFILKKFITERQLAAAGDWFESAGYYVGKICTAGLSHWTYTKPIWNNIVEPYVIAIVMQLNRVVTGIVKGLQSDNPSVKK